MRIECDRCCEEAEYDCDECSCALCAMHAIVSSMDSSLYCPECTEQYREMEEVEA